MLAPIRSNGWIVFGVASVSVLVAFAFRWALDDLLGDHASFSIFYLAVSVTAWFAGFWPAVVTSIVSCFVANYFFTHPHGGLSISTPEELYSLLLFLAVSTIIGGLSEITLRALERARLAERAKDDFMATVAHELRTPLSAIHYATALTRMAGTDHAKENIEVIERQAKHLELMVEDLLDISRVARGKIRLDRRLVDASELVDGALEKVRPLIESRGHELSVEISLDPMPLCVDAVRLEQVLANLLTNAAKYTPQRGRISLSVTPRDQSVVFRVEDNGIGIASEMLPRVFDLFAQDDAAAAKSRGGLGIGLALVRTLVEMHDGSVMASSPGINRGSQFVVSLPMEQPAPKPEVAIV